MHETRANAELRKKKLPILWVVLGSFFVFFLLFLYQLFGPNPPIIVSKETTFVTEPLSNDGLPDYHAYLIAQASEGVTHENNAAVLLWQAMWPGGLQQKDWLPMCTILELDSVPAKGLVEPLQDESTYEAVRTDLQNLGILKRREHDPNEPDEFGEYGRGYGSDPAYLAIDHTIGEAVERPWSTRQLPSLATWIEKNKQSIDLLVEASLRTRFFSPSPNHIDDSRTSLISSLLPLIQSTQDAVDALHLRAMWHLGNDRTQDAWRDVQASFRIARFVTEGNWLVQSLVGFNIESRACDRTVTILGHEKTSPRLAREIHHALQDLAKLTRVSVTLDEGERLSVLDLALGMATNRNTDVDSGWLADASHAVSITRANWNLPLRDVNRTYDRLVAATSQKTRQLRLDAWAVLADEINLRGVRAESYGTRSKAILSITARSRMFADHLLSLVTPNLGNVLNAEDRANTQLELTRLAAALAVYRAEQGEYPETLELLVPAVIPKLPVDLYSGKSFLYERKDDGGYLLYSVYENEIDDRGTGMDGLVISGEWVDEQPADFDYQESDLVIRVPVPPFRLPEPPSEADFEYGYGGEYGGFGE